MASAGASRMILRHGVECAAQSRNEADAGGSKRYPGLDAVDQFGEVKKCRIHRGELVAQPRTEQHTHENAEADYQQHQFEVVRGDCGVGVAHGLECGYFAALGSDLARQHDIEQECRHAEENDRKDGRHGFHFIDFLAQHFVGELIVAAMCTKRAVRLQQSVQCIDDRAFIRSTT